MSKIPWQNSTFCTEHNSIKNQIFKSNNNHKQQQNYLKNDAWNKVKNPLGVNQLDIHQYQVRGICITKQYFKDYF